MAVAGSAAPVGMAAPGVVPFTPSYSVGEVGQPAAADQALLVEETVATGEATR